MIEYVDILGRELIDVSTQVIAFLPNFVIGVVILLLGWTVAIILGRAVEHVFEVFKLNAFFGKLGLDTLSKRSGLNLSIGHIFDVIVRWTIIIAFALAASNIFGLYHVSTFLLSILSYLPSVFIAGAILVVGILLADFVEKIIDGSIRAAGLKVSIAGTVAKYAIVVTSILAALSQLNVMIVFTNTIFIGFIASLSIALGLAFGLGGKDAAARAIEKIEKDFTKK